jgi:predicted dehydrogenase
VVRTAEGRSTVDSDPDSARVAVDREFINAVRGEGADIRVPYAEALRTHELALAVAESAATGRTVTLHGSEVSRA